ncbi:hypothetical protein ES703_11711 [subsurface metagenome]
MASLAETNELKKVAVYSEPALFGETSLQRAKMVTGEVDNYTTVGTNQMMVVLWGTDCIAAADTSDV